jgi:positive regulator of sigma E activity
VAEREIEIIGVDARGVVLRALGACSDCTGCGGRCDLFRSIGPDAEARLPLELFAEPPRPGERWHIILADRELLAQAWAGYGLALVGLVLGAALGYGLTPGSGAARDLATAIGALSGTLLALRFSKRRRAGALQLRRASPLRVD